jgi:hypothetical protein
VLAGGHVRRLASIPAGAEVRGSVAGA